MPNVPANKFKLILFLCLFLMVGVSIWINKSRIIPEEFSNLVSNGEADENGGFYKPPIDSPNEAERLIQKASENYFYHEFAKGAENYRKAIAIYESQKDFRNAARTYESLGDIYRFANEPEEAEESYQLAVDYHIKNRDPVGEGRALKRTGDMYFKLGQMDPAGKWYRKAENAVEGAKPDRDLAKIYEALGQYFWKIEKIPQALVHFTSAQETFIAIKDQMGYDHITNVIAVLKKKKKPSVHSSHGLIPN